MTTTMLMALGIAAIFVALLIGLTAIGVWTAESRGVSRSLAVVEAFTAAPKQLQEEISPPFRERVLVPLAARCVGLGRKLTPADAAERIHHKLDVAGNPPRWTVDRVIALKFVFFAVFLGLAVTGSLVVGLGFGPMLAVGVIAALVGYFAPNMYLYQLGYERTEKMRKALPDALDLLTISVEAGLGFDAALAQVARNTEGPLAHEFARVLQEMQIGLGRAKALRALGERTTVPELRAFVTAMVQADSFGIPIANVLRVQSSEIRVKRRQRAEEKAQKVPVKVLFPLIFCVLPVLFIAVMGPAVITIADNFFGTVR